MDNGGDNDADPVELMGKYDGGVKKKLKGGHYFRYRDNDDIEALRSLYKEPKYCDEGGHYNDDNGSNWDDMEDKER